MFDLLSLPLKKPARSGMSNAGWRYDNYPELQSLDAGVTIELARLAGPGMITCFHITQHIAVADGMEEYFASGKTQETAKEDEVQRATSRGLILEIFYDGSPLPSVRCPLADFFADGCEGQAVCYSTPFVEKLPAIYNSYLPMPFEESILVTLRNTTPYNCLSYSFIEHQKLAAWDAGLQYLHCAWQKERFQLTPDTIFPVIQIPGPGHYIGNQYSITTDEPVFKDFFFIMEGNCEHRIDGEDKPSMDYLGTEGSIWVFVGLPKGLLRPAQRDQLPADRALPNRAVDLSFQAAEPDRPSTGHSTSASTGKMSSPWARPVSRITRVGWCGRRSSGAAAG